jgi:hypothetical protein
MKFNLLFIVLLIVFSRQVLAQDTVVSNSKTLFLNGIYLNNSKKLLPWGTAFNDISQYEHPQIFCSTKTNTKVVWDSAYILDSVRVTLSAFYFRCFEKKSPTRKLHTVYGFIDSADIPKVKLLLDSYTQSKGQYSISKRGYRYYWKTDGCNVVLGYNKFQQAFLNIQTTNFSYWR